MHVTRIVGLLVALLLLVAAACSQGAESTATDEAASPAAQDDASADPTTDAGSEPAADATEPSEAVPAPQVTDCRPASGDEGAQECTTTVFEPQLSMTLPEGWVPDRQSGESPMSASFYQEVDADIAPYVGFNRVPKVYEYPADGGTPEIVDAPDDMVAFLSDLPGVEATEPEPTMVAGREATQLDLTIADPPEAAPEGDCGGPPPPGIFVFNFNDECIAYYFPPDAEVRVLVVELDGEVEPLIIAMEYGAELRDEALADLDAILSSLQIGASA